MPKGGCVHPQGWVCPCPKVDMSMPKGGCVHAQGWMCPCPRVDVSLPKGGCVPAQLGAFKTSTCSREFGRRFVARYCLSVA